MHVFLSKTNRLPFQTDRLTSIGSLILEVKQPSYQRIFMMGPAHNTCKDDLHKKCKWTLAVCCGIHSILHCIFYTIFVLIFGFHHQQVIAAWQFITHLLQMTISNICVWQDATEVISQLQGKHTNQIQANHMYSTAWKVWSAFHLIYMVVIMWTDSPKLMRLILLTWLLMTWQYKELWHKSSWYWLSSSLSSQVVFWPQHQKWVITVKVRVKK